MKRLTGIIPAFLAGLLPVLPLRAFVPAHDLSAALPTNTTFGVQSPAFGVRRSFDPAGRLSTVGSAGVPPATEISFALSYDAQDGGLASVSNAVFVETRSRDLSGNVTNIACKTHSGAFLASFAYCYDAAGLVTQKVGFVNGSAWTNAYTYDARGRLMAENLYKSGSSTVTAFSYDMAGNRLTAGASNFSYSNNRLGGVLHDAAGNITNMVRGGVTLGLAWNTLGQLVSVTTNGAFAESYTYDPLGRRVSTTEGRGTVWHAYDGDECMADLDASGNPLRSYSWGPGVDNLLAVTVYSADATNTYYAVKDHLGSVHALVDESGQLAAQFSYDAWGAPEVSSFLLPPSSFQFRYLFQGREYSWATGLYNFRARWYAPEFGRWLSPDPIGIEGGLNLYEFCRNNPVNFRDPSGEIAPAVIAGAMLIAYFSGAEWANAPGASTDSFGCAHADPVYPGGEGLVNMFTAAGVNAAVGVAAPYVGRVVGAAGQWLDDVWRGGRVGVGKGEILGPTGSGQFVLRPGQGSLERAGVVRTGEELNRVFDSRWQLGRPYSQPMGGSFSPGSTLPTSASQAIIDRGLIWPNVVNNAQLGVINRANQNFPVTLRTSLGGTAPEVLIAPPFQSGLQQVGGFVPITP